MYVDRVKCAIRSLWAMSELLPVVPPLADPFARKITYLRVSLTDRCNYRCTYCMPEEGVDLLPRADVLTFEEIARVVRVFSEIGVRRVRLTGGEPTVRKHVDELVARLAAVDGIRSVVMTTNGHRLRDLAEPLARAGLKEVNISLDTLDPAKFSEITRRGDLGRVLAGVDAALAAGMRVKLNAVALAGVNEGEIPDLCAYAWERGVLPRFIEHMPMSDGALYGSASRLTAQQVRDAIERRFGLRLEAVVGSDSTVMGPSRYWRLDGDARRSVGIISAMTEHFCDTCNRVRITAVGDLHTCLAYDDAVSLRKILRSGGSDDDLRATIRDAVGLKRAGHDFARTGGGAPSKHMISIGG